MEKKSSIDSVKNNLASDIDEAIVLSNDPCSINVLHIMKDLIHNNLKETKRGVLNKSIKNYFDGLI